MKIVLFLHTLFGISSFDGILRHTSKDSEAHWYVAEHWLRNTDLENVFFYKFLKMFFYLVWLLFLDMRL